MKRYAVNRNKNEMSQSIQFQVLNHKQCKKMVESAVKILDETGCCVKNAEARKIFKEAGCRVDGTHVRIPPELTEKCIQSVPKKITLYDQIGNRAFELNPDSGKSYFAPGMCNIYRRDIDTGERRLATKQDVFDTGLVVEALPNIDIASGLAFISDCTECLASAYETRQLLEATNKPVILMTTNLLELETTLQMCEAVSGGKEKLREKPFVIAGADGESPLVHNDMNMKTLIRMFEAGVPTPYICAPMIGATAPVTLAGAIVVGLADNFTGLVLSQLVNEGCPFLGSVFVDYMDMKTMGFSMTAPEIAVAEAAVTDIFKYLHIPNICHMGCTDAVTFDQQGAMDVTTQIYTAMLAGANINFFSGFIETAMCASLESLTFTSDVVGYLNHIIKGIEVNDETLAIEVIDTVGPGGNFVGEEHTMEHFRENWTPEGALERRSWPSWVEAGAKDYGKRANERVKEILTAGVIHPKPVELLAKLDAIMEEAEQRARA